MLPPDEIDHFKPNLEPVFSAPGDVIYQPGDAIRHVYFPDDGMISLLSVTEAGQTVEIGFIGYEGLVGLPYLLGSNEMFCQAIVQVASNGFRIESRIVKLLFEKCRTFRDVVLRYTNVMQKQLSQTCICNHFHPIEARLCRWLCTMGERSQSNKFSLTQEFLSHMLGVQRTSVGLIANAMQNNGIIRYSRGKIEIIDYQRLRQSSCECYNIVRDEFEKFLNEKNF